MCASTMDASTREETHTFSMLERLRGILKVSCFVCARQENTGQWQRRVFPPPGLLLCNIGHRPYTRGRVFHYGYLTWRIGNTTRFMLLFFILSLSVLYYYHTTIVHSSRQHSIQPLVRCVCLRCAHPFLHAEYWAMCMACFYHASETVKKLCFTEHTTMYDSS